MKPKDRVGRSFCGTIWDSYQTDWKFLEYLGDARYLVCRDQGHSRCEFMNVHINEVHISGFWDVPTSKPA